MATAPDACSITPNVAQTRHPRITMKIRYPVGGSTQAGWVVVLGSDDTAMNGLEIVCGR